MAPHAVCHDIACTQYQCEDGYAGDPTVVCNDIDECIGSPPAHSCPVNSNCENTSGSYSCSCKTGYQKDNIGDCIPLPCPPGYTGDMPSGCTALIVGAISLPGGDWGCKEGYELGETMCIDIDECLAGVNGADACHSSAKCLNLVGTYECTCIAGQESTNQNVVSTSFLLLDPTNRLYWQWQN